MMGMGPRIRIGLSMPALRSSMPSCDRATAKKSAPLRTASEATGTAPCPYASALTTAQSFVVGFRRRFASRTLFATASKLISAQAPRSTSIAGSPLISF